jgi:hypothetical protein
MTLLFSQLENARSNPTRFAREHTGSGGGFNSRNFRTYVVAAVRRFHRGMPKADVINFFEQKCADKLNLLSYWRHRADNYKRMLAAYCDAFSPANCQYVESNKRAALQLGYHLLTGKVDRFDLQDPTGYRATAIQLTTTKWTDELRWPLIQKAIANEMGCAPSDVEIGVFSFDDGRYGYQVYSDADISAAEAEAESVLTAVERNRPRKV